MPNNKKIAREGAYDEQFARTTKKSGKWRGIKANLYKKYKRIKKALPLPYIKYIDGFETLIVPKGGKSPILDWGKITYSSKVKE